MPSEATFVPQDLAAAARMLADAVKDKSYRATPVGQLVGRYVRWCRNERGLVDATTIRDYEGTLARMSVTLAHLEPAEVTLEDLRGVIDLWADREPRTRAKVTSAIRGFWKWAEEEGHVERSPAVRLRRPKVQQKPVELLAERVDTELLGAAETARDRLALLVLLDYGVRRSELAGVQVRDFDLARRTLTIRRGKGQKFRVLPLRGRVVLAAEEYLLDTLRFVRRQPEPDDYLLYSEHRNGSGIYKADPKTPMPKSTVHRWWYEKLALAGVTEKGVEHGMNMHRARHTFATELRRGSRDLGVVQRMLGHEDIHTTEAYYGHYDLADLEEAMERFSKERDNRPTFEDDDPHG